MYFPLPENGSLKAGSAFKGVAGQVSRRMRVVSAVVSEHA